MKRGVNVAQRDNGLLIFVCVAFLLFISFIIGFTYINLSEDEENRLERLRYETYQQYVDVYRVEHDALPVSKPEKKVRQPIDEAKIKSVGFDPKILTYEPKRFLGIVKYNVTLDNSEFWVEPNGKVLERRID